MKLLFFIIICAIFSSCGLFSNNETSAYVKSKQYENNVKINLMTNWEVIKNEGADFAIRNVKSNSTMVFNSACRRNDNGNLNSLSSSLLSGIESITIASKKNILLHEREAIQIKASGKLDGITVYFNITTIQKNYCIYDYILISNSLKKLDSETSMFETFINGIKPL